MKWEFHTSTSSHEINKTGDVDHDPRQFADAADERIADEETLWHLRYFWIHVGHFSWSSCFLLPIHIAIHIQMWESMNMYHLLSDRRDRRDLAVFDSVNGFQQEQWYASCRRKRRSGVRGTEKQRWSQDTWSAKATKLTMCFTWISDYIWFDSEF